MRPSRRRRRCEVRLSANELGETRPRDWAAWRSDAVAFLAHDVRDLPRDPLAPPDLDAGRLVRALRDAGVRWVLDGSAALVAAGVEVVDPGDLDVVPDLASDNLERLASLLARLDAFPEPAPDWEHGFTVEEVRRWRPSPAVAANLDHRFVTAHGILDIVPALTGSYDELRRSAWTGRIDGAGVLVADLKPILARMLYSTRAKDRARWGAAARVLDLGGSPG